MATKKSWREKLTDSRDFPKTFRMDAHKMSKRWGSGTCVIPAPLEVDAMMRAVPKGKLTTIDELRKALASKHGTTIACPICTGIFAWIAAHAADEAQREGRKRVTPYWRTLKSRGELNPKYPGGISHLIELLRDEGHVIRQKGKRYFVEEHDRHLAKIGK